MVLYQSKIIHLIQNMPENKILIVENNKKYTSGMLLKMSEHLAIHLLKKGYKKEDRAVIAIAPSIELIITIFALLRLNTTVSLIDPEMGTLNYASKFKQFQPTWAFVDSRLLFLNEHPILKFFYQKISKNPKSFPSTKNIRIVKTGIDLPLFTESIKFKKLLKNHNEQIQISDANEDEPFITTYTSGTLDEPKGVVHSIERLYNSILSLCSLFDENDKKMATHLPHFALIGIVAGLETHLFPQKLSINSKLDFIKKNEITTLFAPPVEYQQMMDYCKTMDTKFPKTLSHLFFGSAPVYPKFLKQIITLIGEHTKLTCLYGMTENLIVSSIDGRAKANYNGSGDILGKAINGVQIEISEENEIMLKSPQLFLGYFGKPKTEGFHLTGDLGRLDQDGNIILLGRKKDMIIRRNTNIYPGLYESTIVKIAGVEEVAMIGKYNHNIQDEEIILIVEGNISEASLIKELKYGKYNIDKEAFPDRFIFMKIPKSGRQNKTDKKQIRLLIDEK